MPWPSLADTETVAHQLAVDPRVSIAWSAINQILMTSTSQAFAFQNELSSTWAAWTSTNQKLLNANLPIDDLFAYINANGAKPPDPATLLTFLTGAGFVNRLGNQVTTPPVGYAYPPGAGPPAPPPPPGLPPPSTGGSGIFDFAGFMARVQADPVGALTTYPGAAAISVVVVMSILRRVGIRL